ncbi:MAG TPA: NYN domain-containing protein [Ktedonobacterales bacterium]|nr:NYN domain-containing protein [Ktedonobacterales bacterium]
MNSRSSDPTVSPGAEEPTNTQTTNSQTSNTGRRHRSPSRRRPSARLVEPAAVETPTGAPEAATAQPAADDAPAVQEAAAPAASPTAAKPRSSSRGRRGGARRRSGDHEASASADAAMSAVGDETTPPPDAPEAGAPGTPVESLPIPASEDAPAAIPAQTDAAAAAVADFVASLGAGATPAKTSSATEEPFLVPTLTKPSQRAPADVATSPAEAPAPSAPVRRYRFDRPARPETSGAAAPFARPERLSGPRSVTESPEYASATASEETPQAVSEASPEPSAILPAPEPITPDQAEDVSQEPVSIELPQASTAVSNDTEATETEASEEMTSDRGAEVEGPATRRRRRRRRGSGNGLQVADAAESDDEEDSPAAPPRAAAPRRGPEPYTDLSTPEAPGSAARNGYGPYDDYEQPYAPYMPATRDRAPQQDRQDWNIGSAYQQMNQPTSPFGAPEPSFARGFGPQPSGVAGPAREVYPRTGRPERGIDAPPMSANQLGAIITQAISRQTDRLLAELRHQQQPPSMTVMLPTSASTERVGVFVDVANLLYSARSLHVSVDFGQLLDFLRGNRRLVRAHAYAPTNPEPQAEQQFLSAVKGLGYRITTKNYKTFASGAKKADLDLDMCMDIVRLVDASAVDTIVLVSGDSDFLPLLEYCSDRGVRVEVAAFEDAAAQILRQSCDLFINLSMVDEIRA